MGKKGWFSAVKKVVRSSYLKKKKEKRFHKSKSSPRRSCHGNQLSLDPCLSQTQLPLANPPHHHYPTIQETVPKRPDDEQQIEQTYSIPYPTVVDEDAADTASHAAAEVNYVTSSPRFLGKSREEIAAIRIQTAYRAYITSSPRFLGKSREEIAAIRIQRAYRAYITSSPRFLGKSREEIAAIRIQTAYRGYMARKAVRPLRAQRRLKLLIQGQAVKRQTESTLMCLQTMARVQSQVRTRKIQMSEVNEALQRQQLQRRKKDLAKEGTWDLSPKSKEQVEAGLKRKKEAAERREKALAYSSSRQQTWRKSLKSANSMSTDPNGTYWGWSWSERWDAVRPWESGAASNGELVEIKGKQVSSQLPSTPPSKALSPASVARLKSASSKRSTHNGSKSLSSSLASSPATRSYKGPTKTTKARSPLMHPAPSPLGSGKKGISNKGLRVGSAKKQLLSLNSSPSGGRRSLGPLRTNSNTKR